MSALTVPLTLSREFRLYAFPADIICSDARGFEVGPGEFKQIVELATSALQTELETAMRRASALERELVELRDAVETAAHAQALENLKR